MEHILRTQGYETREKTEAADLIRCYAQDNISKYDQFKNKLKKKLGSQPVIPQELTSERERAFDSQLIQSMPHIDETEEGEIR